MVDILRQSGVLFCAVVGHSSSEIGAAYAACFISTEDAIRIASYCGIHAKLASSPNAHAPRGAMMTTGASLDDANSLCDGERFSGLMQVAAVNSDSSVTLSGDEDAIEDAATILKGEGIFARKLNVDTAYHSAYMLSCA